MNWIYFLLGLFIGLILAYLIWYAADYLLSGDHPTRTHRAGTEGKK